MTKLIVLSAIVFSSVCYGQKVGKHTYNKVDTFFVYENARVIVYRQNGKIVRDTVVNKNVSITINEVAEMYVLEDEKLKLKHK